MPRKKITIKNADKSFAEIYGKGSNKLYAQDAKIISEKISAVASDAKASADEARSHADSAKQSAVNANEYASRALSGLSTVQSVADTLAWITEHGTMTPTSDSELNPSHVYFIADPDGQYEVGGNHYTLVTDPNVEDISTYYELSVSDSISNYVMTHLSVTNDGLWILSAGDYNYKVLIAPTASQSFPSAGMYIIDGNGNIVAMFGTESDSWIQIANECASYSASDTPQSTFTYTDASISVGSTFLRLETVINGQTETIPDTYYTTSISGTTITITLSNGGNDGVVYIQDLRFNPEDETYYPCTLMATYTIPRHNDTGMILRGRSSVSGSGDNIFDIVNDWRDGTPSTGTGIKIRTIDTNDSEIGISIGLGEGGINRGIWDINNNRWVIYVNSNADTIINGDNVRLNGSSVFFSGHSSRVGASVTKSQGNISVPNGTTVDKVSSAYIQLPKGDWLLMMGVGMPANSTGVRHTGIGTSSEIVYATRQSCNNLGTYPVYLESTLDVHPTANTTYYAYIQQNSGSAMSVSIYWRAIRIA